MSKYQYKFRSFSMKIRNGAPVFKSLLDLVFAVLLFAVFSWNVTPANNEGRLYFIKYESQNVKLWVLKRPSGNHVGNGIGTGF